LMALKIILLLVILVVVVILFFMLAPQFGGRSSIERLENLAVNSTYSKGSFTNIETTPVILPKSYGKMIKQLFSRKPDRVPHNPLPSVIPDFGNDSLRDRFSLIWLGHSTVLIRINGVTIITDPVFSKRASPVSFIGPKTFPTTYPIAIEDLPVIDIVLISHDHFDHLDYHTIKQIHPEIKTFIVPLGIRDHLEKWGIRPEKISETDWWDQVESFGIQFTCTPARHFSGRRKQDNKTLWCSWVIQSPDKSVFYCGDSGYGNHFKEIGEKYGPFDITLMESGAYGKYWPYIHMLPAESVQAHIDLKGKVMLPIHWSKFNLAFHTWKDPINRLTRKAEVMGVSVTTPQIGELIIPTNSIPVTNWWSDL
jgi:L-ascorbate metabolism protein UlaG (beta-lactamase superfamily)